MPPEPERGRRDGVLITRPERPGDTTAALIAGLGFAPVVAPFLRVGVCHPAVPACHQAVLVTSANALASLPVTGAMLLAVGDATAEAARRMGFTHVSSAGRDAEALLSLVLRMADPKAGALLLACGRRQGHGLARQLREHGYAVSRRVFYRAEPVPRFPAVAAQALRAGTLHAAMFLSGETASCFARLLPADLHGALGGVAALAIGKAAADALKPLPWRALRLACSPTLDGVLTLL